jgi:hypothetical protein
VLDLNILSNIFKIKYDLLNARFSKYKQTNTKFLLVCDIGKLLKRYKTTILNDVLYLTKKDKLKIVTFILNIISHYKHYYFLLGCNSTIILYCSNLEDYIEFKDFIEGIKIIIQFIPGFIIIPNYNKSNDNKYIYIHTIYYLINKIYNDSKVLGKKLIVNVLDNNIISYQYFYSDVDIYYLSPFSKTKIVDYKLIWLSLINNEEIINNDSNSHILKILLLPHYIIYNLFEINESKKILYNRPKYNLKNRGIKLNEFINIYNNNLNILPYLEYGKYILDNNSYNIYKDTINNVLFISSGSKIREFIDEFINLWINNLKDNKIHNINHIISNLEDLNTEWLFMEGNNGNR